MFRVIYKSGLFEGKNEWKHLNRRDQWKNLSNFFSYKYDNQMFWFPCIIQNDGNFLSHLVIKGLGDSCFFCYYNIYIWDAQILVFLVEFYKILRS